jgi:hypothetical protein
MTGLTIRRICIIFNAMIGNRDLNDTFKWFVLLDKNIDELFGESGMLELEPKCNKG